MLRPSQAHRWSRCAASVPFEAAIMPEPDSDAAREGTAAAWVADCVLKGDAGSAEDMLGREHKNGWLVTPDMVQHVQGYIDFIRSLGGMTTTETFVRINEFIAGTLDASTAISSIGSLFVTDLKYGFRIVDVFENVQLILYGFGECIRLNIIPLKIILGIYQPRAFHPDGIYRTFELTYPQLYQFATDIIAAGYRALQPNPLATPGTQCRDCRAINSCVAVTHSLYAAYQFVADVRQQHLNGVELGKELDFLRRLEPIFKARLAALQSEGEARIRTGEHIPNWGVKPTYGHRKFTVSAEHVKMLTGIDPTAQAMVTPAELERRGANPVTLGLITETPVVGHKLQPFTQRDFDKAFRS